MAKKWLLSICLIPLFSIGCVHESSNKQVVEAMFTAFNRHDPALMAGLYTNDARLSSSDFCSPRKGRNEVRRTYQDLFESFPDIRDEVETYVVEHDNIAVKFIAQSQAHGPFKVEIATFLTVRAGQIVSDDSIFDTAGRPCSR